MGERPEVLVIEDDPAMRKWIRVALEVEGLHVVEATDGRNAIELVSFGAPDLIVHDLMLPDTYGFQLVAALQTLSDAGDVPLIAISGFRDKLREAWVQRLGYAAYLLKPIEREDLVDTVLSLLPAGADESALGEGLVALTVDDNLTQQKLLVLHLQTMGFQVTVASSGPEALEKLKSTKVDVVLVDLLMPGMDGRAFIEEMRRERVLQEIPVVVVSSYPLQMQEAWALPGFGQVTFTSRATSFRGLRRALRQSLKKA